MIGSPTTPVMMIPAMTEIANHADTPWPSLQTASWLFDKASWFLAASLLVGAVCTVLIVWMGTVKEHHWDLAREAAGEKIGDLEVKAAQLQVSAGQLEKDAAEARLEQERLHAGNLQMQQDVERERAARLALEQDVGTIKPQVQSLMPPAIEPDQIAALTNALKGVRGNIMISYDGGDARAQPLSVQLQRAFNDAGWNVSGGMTIGIPLPPRTGILIKANASGPSATQQRAVDAMKAAKIPFDIRLDRQQHPFMMGMTDVPVGQGADDVEVVVTAPQR